MFNLFKPKWRSMDSAPRDGSYVLVLHRTHGIIQAWFCQGEWEEHYEYGREYTGSSWVLGDDIRQEEVEETPHGYEDGPILGWMPVDALEVIPNYGKCPHECVKNGCIELFPTKMIFKLRNIRKTLKCRKCNRSKLKNEIEAEKHPIHGSDDDFTKWCYGKTVKEMRDEN